MKASKLIEILAKHMNDRDGGDFEVMVAADDLSYRPVVRCWLYPGIEKIMVAADWPPPQKSTETTK